MRGVRARLTATVVALVVLTAAVLGIGAYAFVDLSLHDRLLGEAAAQARFDLSAVVPEIVSTPPTSQELQRLREIFIDRQIQTQIDVDGSTTEFLASLGPALRDLRPGQLAYEWRVVGAQPSLVVGGRPSLGGPTFYFIHDVTALEDSLTTLRVALVVGVLVAAIVALIAARRIARGVLAPVNAAARAAVRLERGDLGARIPVASRDEFGDWALRFNRMADSLQDTIEQLEEAQAQNRRFVADVSHELRTPLTALVAEASILREHLDALPPDARRTGELLVGDVARLRQLVDELMELSRFDAAAEQAAPELVDLGRLVGAIAAARAPGARLDVPPQPVLAQTEPRRLERILGNLLDNAREHAPGSPVEVQVRVDAGGAEHVIAVLDRGPGVPDDRIERIFDRFFKADPSRHGGSSGLGLAIAAEHAALVGGYLTARNRPEGGLRIALHLPVTQPLPPGDGPATGQGQIGGPIQSQRELPP
jgi:signal transduction histidine kinase